MNHQITKQEMRAARETGVRVVITHTEPTRRQRRGILQQEERHVRPVINNRHDPKTREKVYIRMARFAIIVGALQRGLTRSAVTRRMNKPKNELTTAASN